MTKNQQKRAEAALKTIESLAQEQDEVWPWMVERHHKREDASRGFELAVRCGVVRPHHRMGRGGSKIYVSLVRFKGKQP